MEPMSSQATVISYEFERDNNDRKASELFAVLFPDIPSELVRDIAMVVTYIQGTKVNPEILPRVIRGVHNIVIGTGKGSVVVSVDGNKTNVETREVDGVVVTMRNQVL